MVTVSGIVQDINGNDVNGFIVSIRRVLFDNVVIAPYNPSGPGTELEQAFANYRQKVSFILGYFDSGDAALVARFDISLSYKFPHLMMANQFTEMVSTEGMNKKDITLYFDEIIKARFIAAGIPENEITIS